MERNEGGTAIMAVDLQLNCWLQLSYGLQGFLVGIARSWEFQALSYSLVRKPIQLLGRSPTLINATRTDRIGQKSLYLRCPSNCSSVSKSVILNDLFFVDGAEGENRLPFLL
jgi:hypothetical protein